MNIVAIVQARAGSTRLPGKVLADIGGTPMLAHVIGRVQRAVRPSQVIVATTTEREDDAVDAVARHAGATVFRGAVDDVLDRFRLAADSAGADVVARVTADCPLIDPSLVDAVIDALLHAEPRAAFAANTLRRTYPRGLDVEVMRREDLARLDAAAREPYHRAHVFPYAYEHPDAFPPVSVEDAADWSAMRWTVDTAEDLAFAREVMRRLHPGDTSWRSVLALVEQQPELAAINAHVPQKPVHAG
jgi:spore coat polysaccharide biosynthesis protein SpsF